MKDTTLKFRPNTFQNCLCCNRVLRGLCGVWRSVADNTVAQAAPATPPSRRAVAALEAARRTWIGRIGHRTPS